jgi:hypothetical protein
MNCRRLHRATMRLARAATVSILLLTNINSGYAAGVANLRGQTVVPVGAGAMLQLRIPLGGSASARNQASIAFTDGPVWRDEGQVPIFASTLYRSAIIELGLSLSGRPVANFGGIDLMRAGPVRTAAEGETPEPEDGGNQRPNTGRVLLLVGMGALAVIAIAGVVDVERDRKTPYLP